MTTPSTTPPRKTLGITGITINAMTLVAPGAFAWLLYQAQSAGAVNGLGGIWPGVLAALGAALLTAFSFSELARRYANTNLRSAYHFAEQVFRERTELKSLPLVRLAKFVTGWAAHLYYWVYPGVMVAFIGIITDYLLRQMGYSPTPLGQVILALAFAAFIGFLALRGITGTTPSSIILNTIQLTILTVFSIAALIFRFTNPLTLAPTAWAHLTPLAVLTPPNLSGIIFQAALAMLLMVGFEAVTSLGAQAANPQRDIPRATVLTLVLQGAFSYLLVYFASEAALNSQINAAASHAPLGDLALQIGNALLGGNGFSLMFLVAFAVIVALLGALLTSMNNGVRISFSMALDADMPDLLGALNPRYATPYFTVIALSTFAAIIGAIGILGGLPVLMGLILASNMGAFLLYSILCLLTITAFSGRPGFNFFRHLCLPVLGLGLNLTLAIAAPLIALSTGGIIAQAAWVALGMTMLWLLMSLVYYFARR
jgi:basic amino acid/polyamine antiporter, APA family